MPTVSDMLRDKEFKEFRTALDACRCPIKWPGKGLKIPPNDITPSASRLIGTAYNYWLTNCLLPLGNRRTECVLESRGVELLIARGEIHAFDIDSGRSFHLDAKETIALLERHQDCMAAAPHRMSWASHDNLSALLFYAELEHGYRGGFEWNPISIFVEPTNATKELRALMDCTNLSLFPDPVVPNPIFDYRGKKRSINADGDLITGTTLVEAKSGVTIAWQTTLRQLLTYWSLNQLQELPHKIDRLAAYYPRYGVWHVVELKELSTAIQQNQLVRLVRTLADGQKKPRKKQVTRVKKRTVKRNSRS